MSPPLPAFTLRRAGPMVGAAARWEGPQMEEGLRLALALGVRGQGRGQRMGWGGCVLWHHLTSSPRLGKV